MATKLLFLAKCVIHFYLFRLFGWLISAVGPGLRVIGQHLFDLTVVRWLPLGEKVDPIVEVIFFFLINF
jgi:hypothetical protein